MNVFFYERLKTGNVFIFRLKRLYKLSRKSRMEKHDKNLLKSFLTSNTLNLDKRKQRAGSKKQALFVEFLFVTFKKNSSDLEKQP